MRNFQFALRTLAKSPIVSIVAILSLALGIGANTAIFSLFEQTLLRKLPASSPDELVNISANGPRSGSNSTNNAGNQQSIFSYPMFRDLEKNQNVFTGIAAHRSFGANLSYQGRTSAASGMFVSGSYFPILGIQPALGRLLNMEDDRNIGAHPLTVLSHSYWKEKFNESPDVVGKSMVINGVAMTVVGVAPEGFKGTTLGSPVSVFVPISMREALTPGWKGLGERKSYWAYLFARRKPGVSIEAAEASIHSTYISIIRDVELQLQKGMSERTKKQFVEQQMKLSPGEKGQSGFFNTGKAPMVILSCIAAFVLLIACANIANLLLARSANRAKEFSIRLSLGASRSQVMVQLLCESLVLALLAGIAGVFVAYGTGMAILTFLPTGSDQIFEPGVRPITILFSLGVSILSGFLFGLFPAVHSTKMDLATAMKDQAGNVSSTGSASRFRRVLVTAQIALSLLLLVSAGMFLKSLVNIMKVDIGIRTENMIVFGLSPELNQYSPERSRALFEQLEAKASAIPGVQGANVSMVQLIANNNWGSDVSVDGFEKGPDTDSHSMYNEVGAGFLKLMQVPLIKGREFELRDSLSAPKVAIVNEAFERKFGNGKSLLGRRMQQGSGGKNEIEIIGVAKDVKYSEVKDAVPPLFYIPYRQDAKLGSAAFYVATAIPVDQVLPALRKVVAELDPNLPMEDVKTLESQVQENIGLDRMISTLAGAFAGLATLLAAVGLYGVLAFTVARRTREIGIRLAIGADSNKIRNMVLREVAWMVGIGVVLGLPAALVLTKYAESLLYEIKSNDPSVLASGVVLICLVSFLAGYIPARNAMKIEPLEALRYE
jgi:predicted permease